jgi:hypothetical protein
MAMEVIMPAAAPRKMIIYLLAPPILWSVHFLFVYVFVSLACLWTWDDISFLGVGAIEWVVALVTLGIGAAIALVGILAWRIRGDTPGTAFLARMTVMISGLSLFGTLFVGLPTLPTAACY